MALQASDFAALITLLVTGPPARKRLTTSSRPQQLYSYLPVRLQHLSSRLYTTLQPFAARLKQKLPAYIVKAVVPAGLSSGVSPSVHPSAGHLQSRSSAEDSGCDSFRLSQLGPLLRSKHLQIRSEWYSLLLLRFGAVACVACLCLGRSEEHNELQGRCSIGRIS